VKFVVKPGVSKGKALIPASKSHTIRAVFIAALADGESVIRNPLQSSDGHSALDAVTRLGAEVATSANAWRIYGTGGRISAPPSPVNVGNSGTTARFILSTASLGLAPITITGDAQTRSRPMGPLLSALQSIGARVSCPTGTLPATVEGPIDGGAVSVDGTTSQYLSSLLIHTPLAPRGAQMALTSLNEKPYVDMTLKWLDDRNIEYERDGYSMFRVRGGQVYPPFDKAMPGDFSSAAFFACLGAIPGNEVTLLGLDMDDIQGDKAVIDYMARMGAVVKFEKDGIQVKGEKLKGVDFDLNATPDALPALAALAALADGVTTLGNVPQARIKETDRISVMAAELGKMGIHCVEKPDALVVHGGSPKGAKVSGHGDHRVVMSLAVLASAADGVTEIGTAEAVNVTFPRFGDLFSSCGGQITTIP